MAYKMKSPYGMMANQQSKKSIDSKYGTAQKLAKGIKDFSIGALGFAGPGGVGKGLKSFTGIAKGAKNYVGQVLKHGFKKTTALRNAGVKSTKDLRYADKSWTPSAIKKNQPK